MLCAVISLCYVQPSVSFMFSLQSRTSSLRSEHASLGSGAVSIYNKYIYSRRAHQGLAQKGTPQGPGSQRPRGAPTSARPRRSHKGSGGPSMSRPTRAQESPQPTWSHGAHNGLAHKRPWGATRARPTRAQGGAHGGLANQKQNQAHV